jgi:hypothetical protein
LKRQRPALRMALLGVAAALAGFAVIASFLGWQVHEYQAANQRASAVAVGSIIQDGIGEGGDIRVRWADRAGSQHVQKFGIYGTDRYVKGRTFAVAYDPAYPAVDGFPGDPTEVSAVDDLQVPIGIAGVIAAVLILIWVLRGVLFWRARRRSARPKGALALAGQRVEGGPLSVGNSTWFELSDPGTPSRWQRVMWHPAIDVGDGRVEVLMHGDAKSRRRVVVELPDGTCLVPIGRLRHRPPKRVVLEKRSDVRTDLRDSFILPAGTPPPPSQRWWSRGLVFSLVGAAIGVVMGFLMGGGGIAVLPFAAGASAFVVNIWALNG